ncbi:MAG: flavodoxin [Patescibacteria group bacterium]
MKILIAFYSRTGLTKKLSLSLAEKIGADLEEIIDHNPRSGVLGYIVSGREAISKKLAQIEAPRLNPADYDLVIIGTPLWAGTMSSPIRAYLDRFKSSFKALACFTTQQGVGQEKIFKILADFIGLKPLAVMSVLSKEVVRGDYQEKINEFIKQYEKNLSL